MEVLKVATKTLQLAIQTAVAGVKTVVDAIKTVVDATKTKVDIINSRTTTISTNIDTLVAGRVVKSVQRGVFTPTETTSFNITVSTVNPDKCSINLYGVSISSSTGTQFPHVLSFDGTTLVVKPGGPSYAIFNGLLNIGWEIVEYY